MTIGGSLYDVEQAVYQRITQDTVFNGHAQYYVDRVPLPASASRTVASVYLVSETTVPGGRGGKEQITLTFTIVSLSHDLNELVRIDLDRLFHAVRYNWQLLATLGSGMRAFTRKDAAVNIPQPEKDVHMQAVRYRVLFAPSIT